MDNDSSIILGRGMKYDPYGLGSGSQGGLLRGGGLLMGDSSVGGSVKEAKHITQ